MDEIWDHDPEYGWSLYDSPPMRVTYGAKDQGPRYSDDKDKESSNQKSWEGDIFVDKFCVNKTLILKGHSNQVIGHHLSEDEKNLVSWDTKKLIIWNLKTKNKILESNLDSSIKKVIFHPSRKEFFFILDDRNRVWFKSRKFDHIEQVGIPHLNHETSSGIIDIYFNDRPSRGKKHKVIFVGPKILCRFSCKQKKVIETYSIPKDI